MYAHCSQFDTYETENGRYMITIHANNTIDGKEYIVSVDDMENLDADEPLEEMTFDTYDEADKAADDLYGKYNTKEE
jgi:hypothetical protein